MYICTCVCWCLWVCVCVCTHIYICTCVCWCLWVCVCGCTHIYLQKARDTHDESPETIEILNTRLTKCPCFFLCMTMAARILMLARQQTQGKAGREKEKEKPDCMPSTCVPRQKFWKFPFIVTLCYKITRALTFQNFSVPPGGCGDRRGPCGPGGVGGGVVREGGETGALWPGRPGWRPLAK